MNFVLQKKIKDLNTKIQTKTMEEINNNGKININNNINNININLKNQNKIISERSKINLENNEKDYINLKNYEIIKKYQLSQELKWYLFKKKSKKNRQSKQTHSSLDNQNYNDYIWIPVEDDDDFGEFIDPNEKTMSENINRLKLENKNLNKIL